MNAWQKFLEGDESSFAKLYGEFFHKLFAYGLKLGYDAEECKDAIQDVFFTVYLSKNKLSHVLNIEFYLLRALKNRLFDLSGQEKITELNHEHFELTHEENVVDKIITNEKNELLKQEVKRRMNNLTIKQRKVLYYYYDLNLNHNEIATLLDITPDAVGKLRRRALKELKEKLKAFRNRVISLFI